MTKDNTTSQPATEYDANINKTIPYYKIIQEETLRLVQELKSNPTNWLDAGCGTGNLGAKAMQLFPKCSFTLTDPATAMLTLAEEKLGSRANYLLGATEDLQLTASNFDIITACLAHHYSSKENKVKILNNCYQALKPEGIYFTIETVLKDSDFATKAGVELWRKAEIRAGKSEEAANKHVGRLGTELAPITLGEHFSMMKAAGFRIVEVYWLSGMQAAFYAVK